MATISQPIKAQSLNGITAPTTTIQAGGVDTDGYLIPLHIAADGALITENCKGLVSAGNSTTTPLAENAVFLGSSADVIGFYGISYSVYSDKDSAANGIICQFSPDNINWDDRVINTYTYDGTVSDLVIRPHDRYFRIKYTNGSQAQTTFRLQTILHHSTSFGDSTGVDHPPRSGDEALLVKAVISGKSVSGGGAYVDVKVNPSGSLVIGGGVTPSDSYANPTDAQVTYAFNSGWNGSTWDRIQTIGSNTDGEAQIATGFLQTHAHVVMFNGSTFDRLRGTIANGIEVDVKPTSSSTNALSYYKTTTSTNSGVIKASAGRIYKISTVSSSSLVLQKYILFFNTTAVPAAGSNAFYTAPLDIFDEFDRGFYFDTGICWAISSTIDTYTVDTTNTRVQVWYV